jgi:hypothetical protein
MLWEKVVFVSLSLVVVQVSRSAKGGGSGRRLWGLEKGSFSPDSTAPELKWIACSADRP